MTNAEVPIADAVLLGTSPIVLSRAVALCRDGVRPVVLERAARPGGAWTWDSIGVHDDAETGVHLVENRRGVQRALGSLSIELEPEGTLGFGRVGSFRVPLHAARLICFAGVAARDLVRRDWDRLRVSGRSVVRCCMSTGNGYRYPRGGAPALVRALLRELARHQVEPRFGIEVREAVFPDGARGCTLRTNAGELHARRLEITSRAHCPLRINDGPWLPATRRSVVDCTLLRIRAAGPARFRYIEFVGAAPLRRARDLTDFVSPGCGPDERVVCLEWRRTTHVEARARLAAEAARSLVESGLLGDDGAVLDARWTRFVNETIGATELRRLEHRLGNRIRALRSTDFGEDLQAALRAT